MVHKVSPLGTSGAQPTSTPSFNKHTRATSASAGAMVTQVKIDASKTGAIMSFHSLMFDRKVSAIRSVYKISTPSTQRVLSLPPFPEFDIIVGILQPPFILVQI